MKSLTKLRLAYVHASHDRHGALCYYFRRAGFKTVPLPGLPGSAEFMEAYQGALAGEAVPIQIGAGRTKPGTVGAAVAIYFGSLSFVSLGDTTRRVRRRILERLREEHGDKPIKGLERRHVEAMLARKMETPHAARHFLNALRAVIAVAITAGMRTVDPTIGIQNLKTPASDGHKTWNEDHIARFEAAHPIGSRADWPSGFCF
jgi:hypothetical protein